MNYGTPYEYNGWRITFNPALPVTGRWRAERYGVGMCSNSEISIRRMIDAKNMQARNVTT